METISRSLLTFLLNGLWQVPIAAAVAALVCRLMRNGPASHRHAVWAAALLAAILLPMASLRPAAFSPGPQYTPTFADPAGSAATLPGTPATPAAAAAAVSRTVSFAETTAALLAGAYLLFVLFRLIRLAWASVRTVRIRQDAQAGALPPLVEEVWTRCQEAFGLSGVELLSSCEVSGPVAAGTTIILPESLLSETSADVLTTAIGHEMAHIARRDFAFNLLYELLYLPVSFHPAAWLIHRRIEQTREMACDELVTHRLLDAGVYARSIVSIATAMTALPRPGYTLGVFDGDILEERIRRILERPVANLKRARFLLAAGLSALTLCAVLASTLALTARAQGPAHESMKQAESAYNQGDFPSAVEHFQTAVKMEPDNLNAKLFLANALLRRCESAPLNSAEAAPCVSAAHQQYLDVLARDPRNSRALDGLLILSVSTKHFPEARTLAMRAIQANPSDKVAYYTAGFLDWSDTYPDYARARLAAGMKPQDPGIIPDAAARRQLRDRHGAQIEDGFRVLQIALQLDPGYSDAMAYMNLLYRIQAGIVDTDAESKQMIAQADDWVGKALAAIKQRAGTKRPANEPLNVDGPAPGAPAPPPPPPPPPPPSSQGDVAAIPALLPVHQVNPVSPGGATGTVVLVATINPDGKVDELWVASGPPALIAPALTAVKQWTWPPQSGRTKTRVTITFQ